MAEVWLPRQELEEEKDKNAITFQWVQNRRTIDMEENLPLQSQLKIARITIDGLKDIVADYATRS